MAKRVQNSWSRPSRRTRAQQLPRRTAPRLKAEVKNRGIKPKKKPPK